MGIGVQGIADLEVIRHFRRNHMRKYGLILVCSLVILPGCARLRGIMPGGSKAEMSMPEKPKPAPQMQELASWIGSWEGDAELVNAPEGPSDMPTKFKGGHKTEWALGGLFLKTEGWHDMGEGNKENFVEYVTWDPKAGKFRSWWFSDWGNVGEGWMEQDEDGKTYQFYGKGRDASGGRTSGKGSMTILTNDSNEWTWCEKSSMGKLELKGTNKRTK